MEYSGDLSRAAPEQSAKLQKFIPYLVLALVSAIYLYPFVRVLTGTPDEGVFLYGAQAVTWGAVPSRDFVEPQGPGSFYWLALFFKLFGTSLWTARAVLLVTGVATALLVFHLARRIGGAGVFPALFVLATSIPLMIMNSPHYDSNLFGLLSLTTFGCAEDRTNPRLLFLCGALAGLTTCFLQQKGLYLAVALSFALVVLHRKRAVRRVAVLLTGYCAVVTGEFVLYAAAGALPDLIYANFVWPLATYQTINSASYGYVSWQPFFSALRSQFPPLLAWTQMFAVSTPYVLILAVPLALPVWGFFSRPNAFRRDLLPYWLAGYALWASELQRLDFGHLRNGCLILIIVFFTLCETEGRRFPKQIAVVVMACLVLDATGNAVATIAFQTPVRSRRGTLYAEQRDTALEFLLAHTEPGDDVFIYPYQPIYYFLADVRNPTRFSYLNYHLHTNTQFREAVRDLDLKRTRFVLFDTNLAGPNLRVLFPAYRHPPADQLIMEPYLESHYHQIGFAKGFRILERIN